MRAFYHAKSARHWGRFGWHSMEPLVYQPLLTGVMRKS